MSEEGPEFNNGFLTALTLFYGHNDQSMRYQKVGEHMYDYRLDGAKDHLYDMVIPESISEELRRRIEAFKDKVFDIKDKAFFNPSEETVKEIDALFEEDYRIIMALDKELFKLEVIVRLP